MMKPAAEIVDTGYGLGIVIHEDQVKPGPLYAIPPGWKLVPIAPTDTQCEAGDEHCHYLTEAAKVYVAMVDKAPEPPTDNQEK